MKITHVCLVGGYTEGVNYQENNIIKYQALDGHEVSLITTDHCYTEGSWGICHTENDYINPYGVHIIRLSFSLPFSYNINRKIGIFKEFKETLEKLKPNIIFVHNLQFQDIRKVAEYKRKHPETAVYADSHSDCINSARNWLVKNTLYRFWWKPCAKSLEPYTEMFFGVTPARVNFLQEVFGIAKEKTDLLVMGADDESVKRAENPEIRKTIRQKYGVLPEDFLIVTGGKIDGFKTQTLLLLEAVKKIKDKRLKLLIFGSVTEELKSAFFNMCDGIKIQYVGWAKGEQSYEYFASADLVVFPGAHSVYWEQVVAQGIPMLCKYWKGTTHVDIGGNVEFLMEDSAKLIGHKLLELLRNTEKYERMKGNAVSDRRRAFSYRLISRRAVGLIE